MMRLLIVLLCSSLPIIARTQQLNLIIQLRCDSIWKKEINLDELSVIMGQWIILSGSDTVYTNSNYSVYKFIDGKKSNEYNIQLNHSCCDEITAFQFQLGVDSLTHYQEIGCCGLEPGSDLYWTWQSGYIGFKLEGQDKKSNHWQYHLGGFQAPNRSDQKVTFYPTDTHHQNWIIQLHLTEKLFHEFNQTPFKVMSPSQKSQRLMNLIASEIDIFPEYEK